VPRDSPYRYGQGDDVGVVAVEGGIFADAHVAGRFDLVPGATPSIGCFDASGDGITIFTRVESPSDR